MRGGRRAVSEREGEMGRAVSERGGRRAVSGRKGGGQRGRGVQRRWKECRVRDGEEVVRAQEYNLLQHAHSISSCIHELEHHHGSVYIV